MTDAQWAVLEPLLPTPACLRPTGGRPETHHRRAVLDAIFYLVDNGVKWRALPADFPPWRTVYGLFARWSDNLATIELTDRLRASLRVVLAVTHSPPPAVSTPSPWPSPPKLPSRPGPAASTSTKVNGRNTTSTSTPSTSYSASWSPPPTSKTNTPPEPRYATPSATASARHIWADQGHHADALITTAKRLLNITIQIVLRPTNHTGPGKGFHPLPRHWAVERTLARISGHRRRARDDDRRTDHHETWSTGPPPHHDPKTSPLPLTQPNQPRSDTGSIAPFVVEVRADRALLGRGGGADSRARSRRRGDRRGVPFGPGEQTRCGAALRCGTVRRQPQPG
ncbi:transposase [Phytohabitans suffuscus]